MRFQDISTIFPEQEIFHFSTLFCFESIQVQKISPRLFSIIHYLFYTCPRIAPFPYIYSRCALGPLARMASAEKLRTNAFERHLLLNRWGLVTIPGKNPRFMSDSLHCGRRSPFYSESVIFESRLHGREDGNYEEYR